MANLTRRDVRTMTRQLFRTHELDGPTVVLVKQGLMTPDNVTKMVSLLGEMGVACIGMVVDEFDEVMFANEEQMLKYGWQRVPAEEEE